MTQAVRPQKRESGFDAMGKPIPFKRLSDGYTAVREMIPDISTEEAMSLVGRVAGHLERDEPYAALREATEAPYPRDSDAVCGPHTTARSSPRPHRRLSAHSHTPDRLMMLFPQGVWLDDTGQRLIGVHAEDDECHEFGCVIHCPSDHELAHLPRHWSNLLAIMVRIDEDGLWHPDPDELAYRGRHPNHPYVPGQFPYTSGRTS